MHPARPFDASTLDPEAALPPPSARRAPSRTRGPLPQPSMNAMFSRSSIASAAPPDAAERYEIEDIMDEEEETSRRSGRGNVMQRYKRTSLLREILDDPTTDRQVIEQIESIQERSIVRQKRLAAGETVTEGELELVLTCGEEQMALNPLCVAALPDAIRQGFMRKVFGIYCFQTLLTMAIALAVRFIEPVANLFRQFAWLFAVFLVIPLFIMVALFAARKVHPWNMVLFASFSFCVGLALGGMGAWLESEMFLVVIAATALTALSCTLAACKMPARRMTLRYMGALPVLISTALAVAVKVMVGDAISWSAAIGAALIAGAFGLWLLFDVSAIQAELTADEYIVGAMDLYLDVVSLLAWLVACCFLCASEMSSAGA